MSYANLAEDKSWAQNVNISALFHDDNAANLVMQNNNNNKKHCAHNHMHWHWHKLILTANIHFKILSIAFILWFVSFIRF